MSVFFWLYIANIFLNYNDNMHWSLRDVDTTQTRDQELNMLVEQKSRMMFAFILLLTGFFFDYQKELTQRRYTGTMLMMVSALKGMSHLTIELINTKKS